MATKDLKNHWEDGQMTATAMSTTKKVGLSHGNDGVVVNNAIGSIQLKKGLHAPWARCLMETMTSLLTTRLEAFN